MIHRVHDLHHLKCRSNGGTNRKDNLVRVPQVLHRAWHLLFRNFEPPQIARVINETWIAKDWKLAAFRIDPNVIRKRPKVIYECDEFKIILKEKPK